MKTNINIFFTVMLLAVFSVPAYAGFGDLTKSVPGMGGADKSESGKGASVSAEQQQEEIVKSFVSAYQDIFAAQSLLLKAFGMEDKAASHDADAGEISGKSLGKEEVKKALALSDAATKAIQAEIEKGAELSADGKKYYQASLKPMGMGTYKLVKFGPQASKWLSSAKNDIKAAGMMGATKMKKKLDIGLFIAKESPSVIKAFSTNLNSVVTYGKAQGLDTSDANSDKGMD